MTRVEFHISLVGRKDLTGEIYRQLRGAIVEGRLRPGDPLPPSRELAHRLSVSRTTVMVAYDRLNGGGFVTSRVGAGTFVSDAVPTAANRTARADGCLQPRSIWEAIPFPGFAIRVEFDFRTGLPDAALFPHDTWRRLVARELRSSTVDSGYYGDPAGHPALRNAIATHIGASRGVAATANDVMVTTGTQQALDLLARVLLAPGDQVAVEDPGYEPPRRLFESLGLKVAAVPVDRQGLVVDALPRSTRLVFVTPSHQYPLGMSMSLPRRHALLEWAQRHDAAIIEDDYDSEFRFGGRPIEPLQTLDTTGRVIYVGSFSKTMLPSLRLGFVVTPASLHEALRSAKYVSDSHTSLTTQIAMARFIDQGLFTRHIRKMRREYEMRHELVADTLTEEFAQHLRVIPSAAGIHLCATAKSASATELSVVTQRALEAGVAVQPLSEWPVFAADQRAAAGIAVGYGAIPTVRIQDGLRRLRRCFDHI